MLLPLTCRLPPEGRFFPQTHVCSLPSSVARRQRNAQSVPAGKHAVAYVVAVGAIQLQPHTGSLLRETAQHTGHKAGKQRFRHAYARLSRRFQAFAALCAACLRHLRSSDTALLLKGAFALQKCRSLTPPPFCLRISLKSGGALPLAVLNVSSGFLFDRTTVRNGSARPPARILHNFSEALHLCRAEERRALFRPCPHGKESKLSGRRYGCRSGQQPRKSDRPFISTSPPFPPGRAEGTLSTRSAYPALRGGKLPHSAFL